ncbi:MAG: ABC transporter substrate-binding protein [Actinomycetota bacterium]
MKPAKLLLALLAAFSLIAAACGGGDDDGSADAEDSSAAEAETEASGDDEASTDDGDETAAPASDIDKIEVMTRWLEGEDTAAAFAAVAEKFTADTGIEVEIIGEGGEDLDVAYETALLGGAEPHLVVINLFDKTTGWLDAGAVVDVDPYIDEWGLRDSVNPEAVGEWTTADGQVQGFPYSGFAWPFWYNTAALADAGIDGVPVTTDELIAAADALRDNGVAPVVVGGSDWSGQKLFMQVAQMYTGPQGISSLLQEGGFCASDQAMQGITLFSDLLEAGVFIDDVEGYTADLMNETFYTSGAAMMPAGSWAFGDTPEDLIPNIELGGFPLPDGSAYEKPTVYQGFTGVGYMISPRGEEEAIGALQTLITMLYAEENYSTFVPANIVPAIQLSDLSVASDPLLQLALASEYNDATDVALLMDVWVPPASNDGVGQAIALAYSGGSPDEVCAALDSAY